MTISRSKGFTLIELLVVIAIIIMLASIVIVNVSTAREKGRDAKRASDLQSVQTAVEMFNNNFGKYPGTKAAGGTFYLSTGIGACSQPALWCNGTDVKLNTDLVTDNHYLQNLPADPMNRLCETGGSCSANHLGDGPDQGDLAYLYYVSPTADFYVLGTNLEAGNNLTATECGNYTIMGGNNPSCP